METYHGHVRTPADATLLFEACRIGLLPRVQRRLSEKERQQIKSGSVFVWDEREAGMRRWTDGKSWSASRVSGSFLTYREMEGKRGGSQFPTQPTPKRPSGRSPDGSKSGDSEGEGPDGYRYKPDGLMKQSFSITTSSGQHLHLISYYSRTTTGLQQPTQDASLRHIRPPKNMYPESAVNETTNVPAVTRGPMPGSPYAPAPHMGPGSPYSHPGHPPQMYMSMPPNMPPTPNGTPPMPYAAYYPAPPGYSPHAVHYVAYPQYPPHQQAQTFLDRPPQRLATTHPPPPPGQPGMHPQYHPYPPQHVYAQPPRPMPADYAQQQHAHAQGHATHTSHATHPQTPQNGHQRSSPLPDQQGPQLAAIKEPVLPVSRPENAPTPPPSEPKSQDSLALPITNGAPTSNAASPARTIPSVGSLLNSHPSASADGSNSRSGSRSPNSSQMPIREMPAPNSSAADNGALNRLNRAVII